MFGDILSDCASMLTGSLGMLPSASIKATEKNERLGLYEPVYGSAPDISGKKIANPIAMLLSVGMMMEYSFNSKEINLLLKKAINNVLKNGNSTIDIQKKGDKILNTEQMGDEIIKQLDKLKMNKFNIAIVGATGNVGREILNILCEEFSCKKDLCTQLKKL